MSDIVEDVAKSISFRTAAPQQTHPRWDFLHPDEQNVWRRKAKAAIAAAEPHFRRKHRQELLDELISEARERWDDQPILWKMSLDMYVDWLMEQRKEPEE